MEDVRNSEDLAILEEDPLAGLSARRVEKPKSRQCLRCREPFESEWSGERICKRCKSSGSWRSGL